MRSLLRRLRGVIGTGFAWAVAWGALGSAVIGGVVLVGAVKGQFMGWADVWDLLKMAAIGAGKYGFLAGTAFGAVFSVLERHKNLKEISHKRVGLWGVLGGLVCVALIAGLYGPGYLTQWATVLGYAALGVGSATGTVALAKRADRKLLEGEEDLLALEGE